LDAPPGADAGRSVPQMGFGGELMSRNGWITLASAMVLGLALVAGCGYLENKGTPRANIKPKVFITNVPPASDSRILSIDTTWTDATRTRILSIDTTYDFNIVVDTITYLANPRIYWFGTDEDGRVDAFEYAVIPTDSLRPQPVGLAVVRDNTGKVNPQRFVDNQASTDSLDWIELVPGQVDVVNSAEVFLFADIDTSVAIDQFLFVRAIDNLGLRSDIKFARYSRQNHPPQTYIRLDTIETIQPNFNSPAEVRSRKYYSLPQSTATYPGITIGWSGSDSTDFPDEQPAFEFNWVLFGPYTDKNSALPDSAKIVRTNDNLATGRLEWTDQDRNTFFNLRSGWYVFWVRARDDAFVADPTPAIARFQVVEPSFDKPFLLLDATNWTNGSLLNAGSYNFRDARPDSLKPDTLRALYEDLFSNQGYTFSRTADTWYRQMSESPDAYRALPDRDRLARYKALIVYDEDMQITLDRDNQIREFSSVLGEYLNVGGRVVLIGRNLFASSVTGWAPSAPPQEATLTGADFGYIYFGVTRIYFPGHLYYAQTFLRDTADFINVISLDSHYPVVAVDTFLTVKLSQLPIPGLPDRDGDGEANWVWVPDVNWIGIDRTRGVDGFYQFNSIYPNTSPSQGRICGARYEYYDAVLGRNTFRTAVVTIPFTPLKRNDGSLRGLAKALLDYILE
jgi:hypothetical protein